MPKETKDKKILDSDADGLLDSEELELGTDPFDPDTDHDGLGDYIEAKVYHTDPLKADTDCDGVDDGHEVKLGRNPLGKGALKDLFIPHKCNNYRPKALRPRRILFHAVSAIAIKAVMIVLLLSFPLEAYLTPNVLHEQGQRIISLTNSTRKSLSLGTLQNNLILQQAATKKVEDMLVNEYFAHLSPENKGLKYFLTSQNYNYRVAGENLALGFSEATEVYDAWTKSPTHYANIVDPDYEQIGVAMIAGTYKGYETTLAAQYFGTLKSPKNTLVKEEKPANEPTIEPTPQVEPNVLSEKEENVDLPSEEPVSVPDTTEPAEEPETPILEQPEPVEEPKKEVIPVSEPVLEDEAVLEVEELAINEEINNNTVLYKAAESEEVYPEIDHKYTKISVHKPANQDSMVVNVVAVLSDDAVKATAQLDIYSIELSRSSVENNKWTGSTIIKDVDKIEDAFSPVTLASLRVENSTGNTVTEDIAWENITPNKNTVLNQYLFAKKFPSEFLEPLFDYTGIYFTFLMIFALMALIINVVVHYKKQHHDIIASTFGFVILLAFLAAF